MQAAYAILCVLQVIRWLSVFRVRRIRKIGHDVVNLLYSRCQASPGLGVVVEEIKASSPKQTRRKEGK